MNSFNIDNKVNQVEILGKQYNIKIQSAESMKLINDIKDKYNNVVKILSSTTVENITNNTISEVENICRSIVDIVIGIGNYDKLYDEMNNNIFNMLKLSIFLLKEVDKIKGYIINEYIK